MSKKQSDDNPESTWAKPRHYFTRQFWYDDNMGRLPRWKKSDLERFAQAHPQEAKQAKALRHRGMAHVRSSRCSCTRDSLVLVCVCVQLAIGLTSASIVGAVGLRKGNPAYGAVGFVVGGTYENRVVYEIVTFLL
jgi:hypothetical protein